MPRSPSEGGLLCIVALLVLVLVLGHHPVTGGHQQVFQCDRDGVFSFGSNQFGQLGVDDPPWRETPVAVNASGVLNGQEIVALAAGNTHSLVLSGEGSCFSISHF